MSVLERIRESRWRYGIPWSMTALRPVTGGIAAYEMWHDRPWQALGLMVIAQCLDMDGKAARALDATTAAGAIADPVADFALRAEMALTIAPIMNHGFELGMGAAAVAAEMANLALNAKVQKGAGDQGAIIPKEAKDGTAIQSAGVALTMLGEASGKPVLTAIGSVGVAAGSIRRTAGYTRLYRSGEGKEETA